MCSSIAFLEGFTHGFESIETLVLLKGRLRDVVALLIALALDLRTKVFVVHFVAVFALHILTEFLGEFLLDLTHGLDGGMSHLQGFEERAFGHFVHFAFHHHDVLFGSRNHKIHVGTLELFEGGVDHKFSVDASHAHFRDRTIKRNVGASQSSRSSETGKCIGHINAVGAEEGDIHIDLGVIVAGEEGAEGTIDKA